MSPNLPEYAMLVKAGSSDEVLVFTKLGSSIED